MIEEEQIAPTVSRMWQLHMMEMAKFDQIHEYVKGERGRPEVPPGASDEVKQIQKLCVHNVLTLVMDAFVQNLSVVGFRKASAARNSQAWDIWQRNQMDAKQAEIYSSAVKYGTAYVVVTPGDSGVRFKPRSPRQLIAIYEDAQVDRWPQYALETWIDTTDAKPRRKGMFYDDTHMYPLDMGAVGTPVRDDEGNIRPAVLTIMSDAVSEPQKHGATYKGTAVCPVVRYVNRRDAEDLVEGEIERLIQDQRTINEVNFDRLIVARFGAFPQKVITGWTSDSQTVLAASAARAMTFDDDDVKVFTLQAASLDPYNGLLQDLKEHVATRAQVSPAYIVGKLVNLSAEALAAAEANQQRKLAAMRESHGESHEQTLGLGHEMSGGTVDDAAEVVWKDTEARSFAAIVDGITKLGAAQAAGHPIEPYLSLVPGFTQQMVAAAEARAKQREKEQERQPEHPQPLEQVGAGEAGVDPVEISQ